MTWRPQMAQNCRRLMAVLLNDARCSAPAVTLTCSGLHKMKALSLDFYPRAASISHAEFSLPAAHDHERSPKGGMGIPRLVLVIHQRGDGPVQRLRMTDGRVVALLLEGGAGDHRGGV